MVLCKQRAPRIGILAPVIATTQNFIDNSSSLPLRNAYIYYFVVDTGDISKMPLLVGF
jgi:hypothetical protein